MVRKKRQSDVHDGRGSSTESSDEMKANAMSAADSCPHTKKAIDTNRLRKILKPVGLHKTCSECDKVPPQTNGVVGGHAEGPEAEEEISYDNTIWLCMKCGTQLCGRSRNEHALQHFQTPRSDSHALSLNTTTFDIWCYECNKEVKSGRKNLQECTEFIKKLSQKPVELPQAVIPLPPPNNDNIQVDNIQQKIMAGFDTMRPLLDDAAPKHSPPKPPAMPYPGIAKRTTTTSVSPEPSPVDNLPRVRGLTNLGNTCFFNAVMQCLAQTPYLLDVLNELSEAGEEFVLPGGRCKFQNGEEKDLPPIKGCLSSWGGLTQALAETLQELQSGGGVYTPSKLLNKLTTKCPQFAGGDQHDSHELLRQLLESVRAEDLQRYQKVILQNVGYKNQDISQVDDDIRKKCRMYGNQVTDRILRPEQVFRGFLVSTLTCQDCMYVSSNHESFLDMSVPVSVEKPQPPNRRKNSPENSPIICSDPTPSKHQLKKEKEKERKAKRAAKHKSKKAASTLNGENETAVEGAAEGDSGSSEESDADIEDNLEENVPKTFIGPLNYDANSNGNILESPGGEKRGDSPENHNKDDENDSGIAASPTGNMVIEVGLSDKGANIVRQLSATAMDKLTNGYLPKTITESMENLSIQEKEAEKAKLIEERRRKRRVRTQSYSDWNTTIVPRYQCQDGECSVQSCLNNFTAVELMTGSNKVGCEACTKRINGDDEKAKTVYTNATKQYLVSSPPAVLILHLKRFQVEPRGFFRKLTRHVNFPITLDVAPFCGSKVKNLPNINRKQKKLTYALYGIVEHAGGMYGGHYTAYVKVRPKLSPTDKRWKFLPQGSKAELDQEDEQKQKLEELCARQKARSMRNSMCQDVTENDSDDLSTSSSSEQEDIDETEGAVGGQSFADPDNIEPPPGKWYYVSDSRVQEVSEAAVLKSQAYLLFYERIY